MSFNDLDEKSISTLTDFWCITFPQLAVLSTWCCQHAPDYLTLLKNIDWSNKYALSIKKLLLMFLMEKSFFFYFTWFLVLCHFTKLLFCLLNKVNIQRLSSFKTQSERELSTRPFLNLPFCLLNIVNIPRFSFFIKKGKTVVVQIFLKSWKNDF